MLFETRFRSWRFYARSLVWQRRLGTLKTHRLLTALGLMLSVEIERETANESADGTS